MSLTTALPLTGTSPSAVQPRISRGAGRRSLRVVSTVVTVLVSVLAALAIVIAVAGRMSGNGQAMVFGHPVHVDDFRVDDRHDQHRRPVRR